MSPVTPIILINLTKFKSADAELVIKEVSFPILRWLTWKLYLAIHSVPTIHEKTLWGFMSTQAGQSFSGPGCHFVGVDVHRLIYSCGARTVKRHLGTQNLPRVDNA